MASTIPQTRFRNPRLICDTVTHRILSSIPEMNPFLRQPPSPQADVEHMHNRRAKVAADDRPAGTRRPPGRWGSRRRRCRCAWPSGVAARGASSGGRGRKICGRSTFRAGGALASCGAMIGCRARRVMPPCASHRGRLGDANRKETVPGQATAHFWSRVATCRNSRAAVEASRFPA